MTGVQTCALPIYIVNRGAGIDGGEDDILCRRVEGGIKDAHGVRKLRFKGRITHCKIDVVGGSGQRLELTGAGISCASRIIHPQPLPVGKGIGKAYRRGEVDKIAGDGDILGRVQTVEP